jgi:plasmid stabilization system protein ParE
MFVVVILDEAVEDLKNIVAYIASENPSAAEALGHELLDANRSVWRTNGA